MRSVFAALLMLAACGSDATGPKGYSFPEATVSIKLSRQSGSRCVVDFLVTAKRAADVVSYELYAPGNATNPTSAQTGTTPLGASVNVDGLDFFLDWNFTGPGYRYTAPSPGIAHC